MKSLPASSPVFLILIAFFVGCAPFIPPPSYKAYYDISLSEVERPLKAKERYGEQKIEKMQEEGSQKYYFEDEMVKIVWIPTSSEIDFLLTNKTDHSIKIIWDEAAYVDENGVSHRVLHSGTKLVDRNNPQAPTVVVRKGSATDMIYPADYVSFASRSWIYRPLLPNHTDDWIYNLNAGYTGENLPNKLLKDANSIVGKTIQVLLPLQIEDVVNEYIFTLKVNSVEVKVKETRDK